MSEQPTSWTIEHFSQANPNGPGQGDVPALLRRVAATLEQLGAVEVATWCSTPRSPTRAPGPP